MRRNAGLFVVPLLFLTGPLALLLTGCRRPAAPPPVYPAHMPGSPPAPILGPGDIPLYPGSTLSRSGGQSASGTSADGATMSLYETSDPADRVIAFYDSGLTHRDPATGTMIRPEKSRWQMGGHAATTLTDTRGVRGLRSVGIHDMGGNVIIEIVFVPRRRGSPAPFRPPASVKPAIRAPEQPPLRMDQAPENPTAR